MDTGHHSVCRSKIEIDPVLKEIVVHNTAVLWTVYSDGYAVSRTCLPPHRTFKYSSSSAHPRLELCIFHIEIFCTSAVLSFMK